MTPLDWLTIALYFGLLLALTWWAVLRNRNTADDYFLAGRDLGWMVVGGWAREACIMKRLTAAGCLAALLSGFALGMIRLLVDTPVTLGMAGYENGYAPGSWLWILNNIYFQYYGLLIFLVSVIVLIVVSYATPAPGEYQLTGLTFGTVTSEQRRESRRSWNHWDVVNSTVVLLLIAAADVYFNG